ncbi:MAG: hypothetical protein AAF937_00420 [Planctomycetota bacterium]
MKHRSHAMLGRLAAFLAAGLAAAVLVGCSGVGDRQTYLDSRSFAMQPVPAPDSDRPIAMFSPGLE